MAETDEAQGAVAINSSAKLVAESPSEDGQGVVRASLELEMPAPYLWSVLDKKARPTTVSTEGDRVGVNVEGFDYRGAALFVHTVQTGEPPPSTQAGPPSEEPPPEPDGTALDLPSVKPRNLGELIALARDLVAGAKLTVESDVDAAGRRILHTRGELGDFAGGQVFEWRAAEPPPSSPTGPEPTGPEPPGPGGILPELPISTAADGPARGGETVLDNETVGRAHGAAWRVRATSVEDPDSLEAENECRSVNLNIGILVLVVNQVTACVGVNLVQAALLESQVSTEAGLPSPPGGPSLPGGLVAGTPGAGS